MKQTEIVKKVEELISLLPSNSQNGAFGQIEVLRTKQIKLLSKIPIAENNLLWEPDDFKPLFQIKHVMDKGFIQDPLSFSVGRNEIWISTWYGSTGDIDALNDPFVLSWKKFLEKNKMEQKHGLCGNCNPEFFDLEEGFEFMQLWIEWVKKYS